MDQLRRARERPHGPPRRRRGRRHRHPGPRWDERPLACVVAAGETDPTGLKQFLTGYVAKWQVPENWAFVDVIPKTSVGKFDKKALRTQHEKGDLAPRRV